MRTRTAAPIRTAIRMRTHNPADTVTDMPTGTATATLMATDMPMLPTI